MSTQTLSTHLCRAMLSPCASSEPDEPTPPDEVWLPGRPAMFELGRAIGCGGGICLRRDRPAESARSEGSRGRSRSDRGSRLVMGKRGERTLRTARLPRCLPAPAGRILRCHPGLSSPRSLIRSISSPGARPQSPRRTPNLSLSVCRSQSRSDWPDCGQIARHGVRPETHDSDAGWPHRAGRRGSTTAMAVPPRRRESAAVEPTSLGCHNILTSEKPEIRLSDARLSVYGGGCGLITGGERSLS